MDFLRFRLHSSHFAFLVTLVSFLLYSFPILRAVRCASSDYGILIVYATLAFLSMHVFSLFLINRFTAKWIVFPLFAANAACLYFINNYGVYIDKFMIINVMQTDVGEATELFSWYLCGYVLFLGILPAYLLSRIEIIHPPFLVEIVHRLLHIALAFGIAVVIILTNGSKAINFTRMHKPLVHLLIPMNYVSSFAKYIMMTVPTNSVLSPITQSVTHGSGSSNGKKTLMVFSVGETARAKSFSLNGYGRNTNEPLKNDFINFSNFYSCGTATAVSVPCIFSHLPRKSFKLGECQNYQHLLDLLLEGGVNVSWIDNDFGCKGVCSRVPHEYISCDGPECYDELMIDAIPKHVKSNEDNMIVLHHRGSHGPAYHLRYPKEFEIFKPVCDNKDINICTQEQLVNAYDNTIYYTSYVLNKLVDSLKSRYGKEFNIVFFYVSDHGESIGENGIYLHGMPYMIAPKEQIHVPALMWMNDNFLQGNHLSYQAIKDNSDRELSHDYIFHTVLRIFHLETDIYSKDLDILSSMKKN